MGKSWWILMADFLMVGKVVLHGECDIIRFADTIMPRWLR
jgi:hypothetical protein